MGGVSAMGAACFTHPLDLVKVHLQTQQDSPKLGMSQLAVRCVKNNGVTGLWNGLTASLFRQVRHGVRCTMGRMTMKLTHKALGNLLVRSLIRLHC